jgi:hypothetical protein
MKRSTPNECKGTKLIDFHQIFWKLFFLKKCTFLMKSAKNRVFSGYEVAVTNA